MGRLVLAIRSFFAILFHGELPADLGSALKVERKDSGAPAEVKNADGPPKATLQILAILQRDARLVDFLMEDISQYSDEQVGAAVRGVHNECQQALSRYVSLKPIIDGLEGSFTKLEADFSANLDPSRGKLLGNVPTEGVPHGGLLRHRGWRVEKVQLPPIDPHRDVSILAPAEIEIE
jgi:hypothetical protein